MAEPRILDSKGDLLSVGDLVLVFPDTKSPDLSMVAGFKQGWLGWRVKHSWLSGYHPDEPEPSEPATFITGVGLVCHDLLKAQHLEPPNREEAASKAASERSTA